MNFTHMKNCRELEVAPIGARLRTLLLLTGIFLVTAGCTCTAISNHRWAGYTPPQIWEPQDIATNLRTNVNEKVPAFAREAGIFSTQFKRLGISGWSDLGYDGEVVGTVLQTAKSTDKFYTVDMKLETFQIDGHKLPLEGDRYLRAEVCLCDVELSDGDMPHEKEKIWMRGRMVWDGDGFVEIHPRSTGEVKRYLSKQ
jgi:hypothetical protein